MAKRRKIVEGMGSPASNLKYITEVFACDDGGAEYANLMHGFLPMLEKELDESNEAAMDLADIIERFARLVEIGTRRNG